MATKAKQTETHPQTIHTTQAEYLRVADLVKFLPISANSIWRKSKTGQFPKPIKLSAGVTCWKTTEVRAWLSSLEAAQ